MTQTSTPAAARTIVTVGFSGTGVRHYGYGADATHQAYTSCGAERRHVGTGAVRVVPGATEATCKACNPTPTAAAARPTTAPATCPTHKGNAAYAPKTVKAGTYVGFPCGCKVWTA